MFIVRNLESVSEQRQKPRSSSIFTFLFVAAVLQREVVLGGLKSVFMQSDKDLSERPQGQLQARLLPGGIPLADGTWVEEFSLVQLNAAVYGLVSAPSAWTYRINLSVSMPIRASLCWFFSCTRVCFRAFELVSAQFLPLILMWRVLFVLCGYCLVIDVATAITSTPCYPNWISHTHLQRHLRIFSERFPSWLHPIFLSRLASKCPRASAPEINAEQSVHSFREAMTHEVHLSVHLLAFFSTYRSFSFHVLLRQPMHLQVRMDLAVLGIRLPRNSSYSRDPTLDHSFESFPFETCHSSSRSPPLQCTTSCPRRRPLSSWRPTFGPSILLSSCDGRVPFHQTRLSRVGTSFVRLFHHLQPGMLTRRLPHEAPAMPSRDAAHSPSTPTEVPSLGQVHERAHLNRDSYIFTFCAEKHAFEPHFSQTFHAPILPVRSIPCLPLDARRTPNAEGQIREIVLFELCRSFISEHTAASGRTRVTRGPREVHHCSNDASKQDYWRRCPSRLSEDAEYWVREIINAIKRLDKRKTSQKRTEEQMESYSKRTDE